MYKIYQVGNETLEDIAKKLNTNVDEIVRLNGTSNIISGSYIIVPANKDFTTYIVKQGDNIYSIAKNNGVDYETLLKVNGLDQNDYIYPNQEIIIPNKKIYVTKENETIKDIINKLNINNIDSLKEKIRVFHDYIATINVYDSDKENGKSNYNSDKAIGTLFEGHSICSGYTDTLSLFLDKINLKNYKIANDEHTWNVVLINGDWYHIDLTWDDPITNTGENIIQYNYFLITTPELESKNEIEHNYSKEIYNFIK